jgi:hypothetical protein
VFEERWGWIERRMLPRWQRLSDRQTERVDRRLRAAMKPALYFSMADATVGGTHTSGISWRHMTRMLFATA